jgi:hypothetical protein
LKVKIGNREQIASVVLLVPSGEDAMLEFSIEDLNITIHIEFVDDKEDANPGIKIEGVDNQAKMTIKNWNSSLPMAILEPMNLLEINGKTMCMVMTGYSVSGFKRVEISLLWEKQND